MSTEAATAVSAAPALHSDSGDDLMSDFVVLSKSPQEESLLVVENPALAQLQLSLPSGDISLDEAEQCVRDLLRENRELKGKSNSTHIASGHPMVPVCSLVREQYGERRKVSSKSGHTRPALSPLPFRLLAAVPLLTVLWT
ncbi:hypothetical protein HPB47_004425 [Ixodes persulcatus]|uniref:Uncharacterized protein n=1 Tax=Ixodes persulcatus TaxID=34615 RepID=A0AC60PH98_IXOPE|nr:hypothetical protein HPB47_004425 [Ixodes persulcatus]